MPFTHLLTLPPEDAAYKRIRAARAARQFPALFDAVAEGRLHLAAVCLLAPYLTVENANELIEAATHRRKSDVEVLLARRFSFSVETASMPSIRSAPQLAPGRVGTGLGDEQLAPGRVEGDTPAEFGLNHDGRDPAQVGRVEAAPPERFLVRLAIPQSTHDKLRYAQALLSHAVPTGDVAQVLDRALDALITQLQKRKFGAVSPSRPGRSAKPRRRSISRTRYIPPRVRRAVWERDEGQCTFVSAAGHRCSARRFLEFDHIEPVARGGRATVDGMRLRCRAHNQYEAERTFGAEFMIAKREEARARAKEQAAQTAKEQAARAAKEQAARAAEARARAAANEQIQDVVAGLRGLGCRADEARRAAQLTESLLGATLEERMRAALGFLRGRSHPAPTRAVLRATCGAP